MNKRSKNKVSGSRNILDEIEIESPQDNVVGDGSESLDSPLIFNINGEEANLGIETPILEPFPESDGQIVTIPDPDPLILKEELEEIAIEMEEEEPEPEIEQGIDIPDMIDDPVRMYLREIGRVHLLTAQDERNLARSMECGNQLRALTKELTAKDGWSPKAYEVMVLLIRKLHDSKSVSDILGKHLGFTRQMNLTEIRSDTSLLRALDHEIEEELLINLAQNTQYAAGELKSAILHLSVNSRLVPENIMSLINEETTLEGLADLLDDTDFLEDLYKQDTDLQLNIETLIDHFVGQRTQDTFEYPASSRHRILVGVLTHDQNIGGVTRFLGLPCGLASRHQKRDQYHQRHGLHCSHSLINPTPFFPMHLANVVFLWVR